MTLLLTNEEVEKLITVENAIEVLEPTFDGAMPKLGHYFGSLQVGEPDEWFLQDVHP